MCTLLGVRADAIGALAVWIQNHFFQNKNVLAGLDDGRVHMWTHVSDVCRVCLPVCVQRQDAADTSSHQSTIVFVFTHTHTHTLTHTGKQTRPTSHTKTGCS